MKAAMSCGCRTGSPSYISWQAPDTLAGFIPQLASSPSRLHPPVGFIPQSGTKNWASAYNAAYCCDSLYQDSRYNKASTTLCSFHALALQSELSQAMSNLVRASTLEFFLLRTSKKHRTKVLASVRSTSKRPCGTSGEKVTSREKSNVWRADPERILFILAENWL